MARSSLPSLLKQNAAYCSVITSENAFIFIVTAENSTVKISMYIENSEKNTKILRAAVLEGFEYLVIYSHMPNIK